MPIGIGYFKRRWIGDFGHKISPQHSTFWNHRTGERQSVTTKSKREAEAVFDYLKSMYRKPKMFTSRSVPIDGKAHTIYAVYIPGRSLDQFVKRSPTAKRVKR